MPNKRFYLVFVLTLLLIGSFAAIPAQAQGNLLSNPGFEAGGNWTPVRSGGGGTFAAPPGWGGWLDPASAQVPNGFPHNRIPINDDMTDTEEGIANANNLFIRSGNRSANFGRGFGAYTGAIYQQISVTEGDNLIGTAYMIMNIGAGSDFAAVVGIDPNGGTDPNAAGIIWSPTQRNQIGSFTQLTVNATAAGPTVTFYLAFTQRAPIDPNGIYWDDASLTIGGPGGSSDAGGDDDGGGEAATPVPTVPQTVPNVIPQGQQEDGSIVHTVVTGDTVNSIAVAYGVSASRIIELNNLANARLISVGQRLLIRPPTEPTAAPTEEAADEEADEADEEDDTDTDAQAAADDAEDEVETDEPEPTEPEPTDEPTEEPTEEETEEPEPTVVPTSTPEPEPTNTPRPAPVADADADSDIDLNTQVASLCVMIYEDINGDTVQQADELSVPGGLITLTRAGEEVDSFVTDDSPNMSCFNALEPGQYIVDASAPAGFTLLPSGRSRPNLPPGQEVNIVFAAVDSSTIDVPAPEAADGDEAVAPPALDAEAADDSDDDDLTQYIGLIVFALAAVTLIGGIGLTIAVRGR